MSKMTKQDLITLHNDYANTLPQRIKALEEIWHQLKIKSWEKASWDKFYREVHNLCGSSGTHGYYDLSKSLRQLVTIIEMCHSDIEKNNYSHEITHSISNIQDTLKIPPITPSIFL